MKDRLLAAGSLVETRRQRTRRMLHIGVMVGLGLLLALTLTTALSFS